MKRVYLNTPEEVIKALIDGKEIFLEEGGAGKVKLIDGFCVKEWNDQFNINYTINLRDKPFVYEQETLIIEVGKFYKTRDGRKARCFFTSVDGDAMFSIDGYDAILNTNSNENYLLDIIGPWED